MERWLETKRSCRISNNTYTLSNNWRYYWNVLDKAVQPGATNVNSINFELTQETENELREELLGLAAKEAKSKADSLSDALNVDIIGVKSVSESTFNAYPYVYRGYAETAAMDIDDGMKASTQINPQNIDVSATVSVIYSIE